MDDTLNIMENQRRIKSQEHLKGTKTIICLSNGETILISLGNVSME
jgi:hypothetical protein